MSASCLGERCPGDTVSHAATAPPTGRIYQIEYAIAAIQNAAACVGIQTSTGIVIASEKKVISKLLAPIKGSEKTYKLAEHLFVSVAGLTSDASVLVDFARVQCVCRLNCFLWREGPRGKERC